MNKYKEISGLVEKTTGIRLRTALFRWALVSIGIWLAFNGLIAAFEGVFEAFLFRLAGIVIFDIKYILLTVLLWGLLFYFLKSINDTWKNMTLSIAMIFFVVVTSFLFISQGDIEKSIILDRGVFIYLSLLLPRLLFSKLKPGNIL